MSEGQFKAKIRELGLLESTMHEVDNQDLFAIVDEAKADFPEIHHVSVEGESVPVIPMGDAIKWFEKWFGK